MRIPGLLVVAVAVMSVAAFAGSADRDCVDTATLDTNHDGVIDTHEAKASPAFAKHFEELDENQNQRIDAEELRRFESRCGSRGPG